jgi:TatA/E family protein of Tat protein translocase
MFNIGPLELMVILLLALVVVGPSKLPEVGRSIGRALREFRKVQDEVRDSINFNLDAEPVTPRPATKPGPPPAAVERARAAAAASAPETQQEQSEPAPELRAETPADIAPTTHAEPHAEAQPPEPQPETAAETIEPSVSEEPGPAEPSPGSPNGSTPTPEPPPE